jgi:hypothetical protein
LNQLSNFECSQKLTLHPHLFCLYHSSVCLKYCYFKFNLSNKHILFYLSILYRVFGWLGLVLIFPLNFGLLFEGIEFSTVTVSHSHNTQLFSLNRRLKNILLYNLTMQSRSSNIKSTSNIHYRVKLHENSTARQSWSQFKCLSEVWERCIS